MKKFDIFGRVVDVDSTFEENISKALNDEMKQDVGINVVRNGDKITITAGIYVDGFNTTLVADIPSALCHVIIGSGAKSPMPNFGPWSCMPNLIHCDEKKFLYKLYKKNAKYYNAPVKKFDATALKDRLIIEIELR